MSRKSAVKSVIPLLPHLAPSRFFESVGKSRQQAKHRAAMKRRNAFLDLQAAHERHRRWAENEEFALAAGFSHSATEPEVDPFIRRHQDAVTEQHQLLSRFS